MDGEFSQRTLPESAYRGFRSPHREAIKYWFERPFSPRRGAEQRAVVDASLAHTLRSDSEAFVCRSTHPARCEHRRMTRGEGQAILVTFGATAKSDWPRAAIERAGGKRRYLFSRSNARVCLALRVVSRTGSPAAPRMTPVGRRRPHPNPLPQGERGQNPKPIASPPTRV